jgi:hypothetical protein
MMDVKFEGFSDDLFHITYNDKTYEYGEWDLRESIVYATIRSDKPDGIERGLKVLGIFDLFGTWSFAPGKIDEDTPLLEGLTLYYDEVEGVPDTGRSWCMGLTVKGVPPTSTINIYNKDRDEITMEGV